VANKEYQYRVTAENEGGESKPSEPSDPIKAKPLRGLSLSARHTSCRIALFLLTSDFSRLVAKWYHIDNFTDALDNVVYAQLSFISIYVSDLSTV